MATWIDWHSHHTAPEAVETFAEFTGKRLKIDDYDSTDFADRVQQMDEVGIDLQLICQGAGLYADQLPADQALAVVRQSNDLLAQRIAPHRQRLMGVTAFSLKISRRRWRSWSALRPGASRGFVVSHRRRRNGCGSAGNGPALRQDCRTGMADLSARRRSCQTQRSNGSKMEEQGGVAYAVLSDAEISECALRMIASGVFDRYPDLRIVIRSSGGGLPLFCIAFLET